MPRDGAIRARIGSIVPGGSAAEAGLTAGDILVEMNGQVRRNAVCCLYLSKGGGGGGGGYHRQMDDSPPAFGNINSTASGRHLKRAYVRQLS